MGYYASYGGWLKLKKDVAPISEIDAVVDKIRDSFEDVHLVSLRPDGYDENVWEDGDLHYISIDGYSRYYPEEMEDAVKMVAPYCVPGCMVEFKGEDVELWCWEITEDGGIRELEGKIIYLREPEPSPLNKFSIERDGVKIYMTLEEERKHYEHFEKECRCEEMSQSIIERDDLTDDIKERAIAIGEEMIRDSSVEYMDMHYYTDDVAYEAIEIAKEEAEEEE